MKKAFENVAEKMGFEIVEFNGEADHVHLLIEYPLRLALSKIVNSLKGVSSRILRKYPAFQKEYWGDNVSLWSRSYSRNRSNWMINISKLTHSLCNIFSSLSLHHLIS